MTTVFFIALQFMPKQTLILVQSLHNLTCILSAQMETTEEDGKV